MIIFVCACGASDDGDGGDGDVASDDGDGNDGDVASGDGDFSK